MTACIRRRRKARIRSVSGKSIPVVTFPYFNSTLLRRAQDDQASYFNSTILMLLVYSGVTKRAM